MRKYTYKTKDNQDIILNMTDCYKIYRWYKETCTADYILSNPKFFGEMDEQKALEIASDAWDVIENSEITSETEDDAIFEVLSWEKENK